MTTTATDQREEAPVLQSLPTDQMRQTMWRFDDREDLKQVVQSARSVARGLVAQLVSQGQRNTFEWTDQKGQMLDALDQSGLTALFVEPEYGGSLAGPRSLAEALASFELAWVDGGAATCSIALRLALQPIVLMGTAEQKERDISAVACRQVPAAIEKWFVVPSV